MASDDMKTDEKQKNVPEQQKSVIPPWLKPYAVGAGVFVVGAGSAALIAPPALAALGFGAGGIAAGSLAAKGMSVAWTKGIGMGLIGAAQSTGATGAVSATTAALTGTLATGAHSLVSQGAKNNNNYTDNNKENNNNDNNNSNSSQDSKENTSGNTKMTNDIEDKSFSSSNEIDRPNNNSVAHIMSSSLELTKAAGQASVAGAYQAASVGGQVVGTIGRTSVAGVRTLGTYGWDLHWLEDRLRRRLGRAFWIN